MDARFVLEGQQPMPSTLAVRREPPGSWLAVQPSKIRNTPDSLRCSATKVDGIGPTASITAGEQAVFLSNSLTGDFILILK